MEEGKHRPSLKLEDALIVVVLRLYPNEINSYSPTYFETRSRSGTWGNVVETSSKTH